jgi:hypothetical protein
VIGYMDPGNWATDLAGARYGYAPQRDHVSNLMAILLQALGAPRHRQRHMIRAGVPRQLLQTRHDRPISVIAIAACDRRVTAQRSRSTCCFMSRSSGGVCHCPLDVLVVLYITAPRFAT